KDARWAVDLPVACGAALVRGQYTADQKSEARKCMVERHSQEIAPYVPQEQGRRVQQCIWAYEMGYGVADDHGWMHDIQQRSLRAPNAKPNHFRLRGSTVSDFPARVRF